MIDIKLPSSKGYNTETIESELQAVESYQALYTRGEDIYARLRDTATPADMNQILAIADAHDASLSVEQLSEQARQELATGGATSKRSWTVIKAFNDGPEGDVKTFLQNGGTSVTLDRSDPLNLAYTHWRPIFEGLPDAMKVRIMWYGYMNSTTYEFYPEPETPSSEYKAWFNNACAQVMGYMTDRAQM